jgi:hypothetical protein
VVPLNQKYLQKYLTEDSEKVKENEKSEFGLPE